MDNKAMRGADGRKVLALMFGACHPIMSGVHAAADKPAAICLFYNISYVWAQWT